jgi:hypothetical protein
MDKLTDPHAPASSTAGPSSTSDNLYPLSYYEMGLRESLAFWPKVEVIRPVQPPDIPFKSTKHMSRITSNTNRA